MSFPRYPEYNASNIEWFEEYPSHWTFCRADAFIASNYETITPEKMQGATVFHYSIPIVQETGDGQYEDGDTIDSSKFRVTTKQVLVSKLNPRKGTVCLAQPKPELTVCSGEFIPLTSDYINLEYLLYSVKSSNYRFRLESLVESATRSHKRAAPDDILKFHWAFPPKEEQTQIARFLDHQTARIDALIAEQQRLIELLKEKRQAVISHAVTKGLDPNVAMKDSGVEWLGEVPEHWDLTCIKHCCYINDGNHGDEYPTSEDFIDEDGVPFIRGGNLNNLTVTNEGMLYITHEKNQSMRKGRLQVGDILFVNRGEIGKLAVVPSSMEGANLNSQIAYLRVTDESMSPEFLVFYLSSSTIKAHIEAAREGSVLIQYPISDLASIRVPVPPKSEQEKIASHLSQKLFLVDTLVTEARISTDLLMERRSALITAAVTGKIDVRDWEPPVSETFPQSTASEEAPA